MNKKTGSNWRHVFRFTFKQATSSKGFKGVTFGLILLLFLGGIACNMLMAVSQKSNAKISSIKNVHVVNESGINALDLDGFLTNHKDKYPDASFVVEDKSVDQVIESLTKDTSEDVSKNIIAQITKEEQKFLIQVILPSKSQISEKEAEQFGKDFSMVIEQGKLLSLNIPVENIVVAMSDVSINTINAGEEQESIGVEIAKILLPMLFIMLMYFMNLVYGQSMGNIVSSEKTSKLMEYLLTLTKPHHLIFGKIMAMASIGIVQMLAWIGAFVGGFYTGDLLARKLVYSQYNNGVIKLLKLIQGTNGGSAFSVGAIILTLITICFSFILYCMLAGMIASFASKAEDLAQTMGIYQIIVAASFFASYIIPLKEKPWMNTILRAVPFTGAYTLPGDILLGKITVLEGGLYFIIIILFITGLVFLTGKVYKNQLFNSGKVRKFKFLRK